MMRAALAAAWAWFYGARATTARGVLRAPWTRRQDQFDELALEVARPRAAAAQPGVAATRPGAAARSRTEAARTDAPAEDGRRLAEKSDKKLIRKGGKTDFQVWELVLAAVLVLTLGSLAAGAGIGGGGLFVPIYWLVLFRTEQNGAKAAIPLSKATILGGAIGNFLSIGWQRHPKAERPMIDYDTAVFMQSGELLGVIFGVLLNRMLPELIVIIFLVILLSYNTKRTLRKAYATRHKETQALLSKQDEDALRTTQSTLDLRTLQKEPTIAPPEEVKDDQDATADATADATTSAAAAPPKSSDAEAPPSSELQALLAAESVQFPPWAWKMVVSMTLFTMLYGILKTNVFNQCATWSFHQRGGAGRGQAGPWFWIWYFVPVPVLLAYMYYTTRVLRAKTKRRAACPDYEPLPADLVWDDETLAKFPKVALLAGVAAGLLGIGGGMVIGPLFMEIGMEPQVGTSTCAFMILWTAASGVVLYYEAGLISPAFIVWCVFWGFFSGQLGQRGVNHVIKKTGRPSYVIFLLGSIIGVACATITLGFIARTAQGDVDTKFNISGFLCTKSNSKS
mmetsp:Transcript_19470/g.60001  ORF Transcript_19470/g.60001 Transcript_19470/m.60001 type:complete len:567 (+) Transcript_19470:37-1737(+)